MMRLLIKIWGKTAVPGVRMKDFFFFESLFFVGEKADWSLLPIQARIAVKCVLILQLFSPVNIRKKIHDFVVRPRSSSNWKNVGLKRRHFQRSWGSRRRFHTATCERPFPSRWIFISSLLLRKVFYGTNVWTVLRKTADRNAYKLIFFFSWLCGFLFKFVVSFLALSTCELTPLSPFEWAVCTACSLLFILVLLVIRRVWLKSKSGHEDFSGVVSFRSVAEKERWNSTNRTVEQTEQISTGSRPFTMDRTSLNKIVTKAVGNDTGPVSSKFV
jgi:hypothetical protein